MIRSVSFLVLFFAFFATSGAYSASEECPNSLQAMAGLSEELGPVLLKNKEPANSSTSMMLGILAAEVDGKMRFFYWNYMKQDLNHKTAGKKIEALGKEVKLSFGAALFLEADFGDKINLRIQKLGRSFSPEVFQHPEPSLQDLGFLLQQIQLESQIEVDQEVEVELAWPSLSNKTLRKKMKDLLLLIE